MTAQEALREILSLLYQRLASDPQARAAMRRVERQTATFTDTAQLSERASVLLGAVFGGRVLDVPEELREAVCTALLRERYDTMNGILADVQEAADEALGLSLDAAHAPFPSERVQTVAHSLIDPGVTAATIQRRANKPVATVARSFHDDFIETNAKKRSDLGLRCHITRETDGKCCPWCDGLAGRYVYGRHPGDIFRRHDNCGCTVTYEEGRQRQDVWTKRSWERVDPEEVAAAAQEPIVFSREDAAAMEESLLSGLTNGARSGMMRVSGAISGALDPDSNDANEHAKRYYASVRKMKTDVDHIAKHTGIPRETIQAIKDFIFNEKHDLGEKFDYFEPDYMMAQSWQRLIDGKNIQEHDLTLLRHEQMERELMQQGLSQSEAHKITSQTYNYGKEARAYYDRIKKHYKK